MEKVHCEVEQSLLLKGQGPQMLQGTGAAGHGVQKSAWFQVKWPHGAVELSIVVKELFLIIVAGAIWGKNWPKQKLRFLGDNESVVAVMKSRTSRNPSFNAPFALPFLFKPSMISSAAVHTSRENGMI